MTSIDASAPSFALPPLATQARSPVIVAAERPGDAAAREALLDAAYGPARFGKPSAKLRRGRLPADGLALVARHDEEIVGTVRLWHVLAGSAAALLLGPLAVDPRYQEHGIGTMLMREAVEQARVLGHGAILLVGDAPYYARFGFRRDLTIGLRMPGPVDPDRFLGLELQAGALRGAKGLLRAAGVLGGRRGDLRRGMSAVA